MQSLHALGSNNSVCGSLSHLCLHTIVLWGEILGRFFGFTTLIVSAIAVYLIIMHSPAVMEQYKYLILLVTITDFASSFIIDVIFGAILLFPTPAAVFLGPIQYLNPDLAFTYCFAGYASLTLSMMTISCSFFYRYLIIAPPKIKALFWKRQTFVAWTLLTLGILMAAAVMSTLSRYESEKVVTAVLLARPYWQDEIHFYVIGGLNDQDKGYLLASVYFSLILVIFEFCFNITFYVLIRKRLTGLQQTMTTKTYRMHRMFLRVLLVQQSIPTFCIILPVIIMASNVLLAKVNDALNVAAIAILLSFQPANCIVSIFGCTPYRKALLKICRKLLRIGGNDDNLVEVTPIQST